MPSNTNQIPRNDRRTLKIRDLYLWLDTRPPLPVGGEAGFGMALALALPLVVTVLRLRFDFFGAW